MLLLLVALRADLAADPEIGRIPWRARLQQGGRKCSVAPVQKRESSCKKGSVWRGELSNCIIALILKSKEAGAPSYCTAELYGQWSLSKIKHILIRLLSCQGKEPGSFDCHYYTN